MFSFVGDTVLDPFAGTFTTALAALQAGRSSIGVEIDPTYYRYGLERVRDALREGVPGLPQGTLVTESESEEAAGAADVASPSTDAMQTAARYCL
jgi:site-specific DNA-methyltransferase (adenine-specific)